MFWCLQLIGGPLGNGLIDSYRLRIIPGVKVARHNQISIPLSSPIQR